MYGTSKAINLAVGLKEKNKDKVLKDIINKLDTRPIKTKASWPSSKIGLRIRTKEKEAKGVKRINTAWTEEDIIEPLEAHVPNDSAAPNIQVWVNGSCGGRPPPQPTWTKVKSLHLALATQKVH